MSNRPLRVVVLCSGSASSLRWLHQNDPNFGKTYDIVGVFSDEDGASGVEYAKNVLDVPAVCYSFDKWLLDTATKKSNLASRSFYFSLFLNAIAPCGPQVLMLSGFMLVLTDPILSEFSGRILNVHPALLSIEDEKGGRKYAGLDVVRRAMENGDPTGSTVHIVTPEVDMGPIVVESAPLAYQPGDNPDEHQEQMKTACDGPAFQKAFEVLIAHGWPDNPWP